MDLSSPLFLFLFLPVFLSIYLINNYLFQIQGLKLPIILAASVFFLTWGEQTALWWLGGIVISGYAAGLVIAKTRETGGRFSLWLWAAIVVDLAILSFFKFSTAFGESDFIQLHLPQIPSLRASGLAVPIGLSYITFQVISYLMDVWRGKISVEKNFIALSTYLLFFPKLISGPITHYKSFARQMEQLNPTSDDIAAGFRCFLKGFVKRALIASQLSPMVNAVFNLPTANIEPKFAWLALIAFAVQIFFDFSGYTDMAVGLGMMIGIRLPENFDFPYIAQSVNDFWRRWHMTLSTWFREYVFFPLERRRFKWAGQQINVLIVFLLTGLWHGFKPTFIVWGLLHGFALAVESAGFGHSLKQAWRPIRHVYTLFTISAGWVFFRSNSLLFAFEFFGRLAGNKSNLTPIPFSASTPLPFIEPSFILALTAGIFFSLPISSVWNKFCAKFDGHRIFLLLFFEDASLVLLFILGLALLLGSSFQPNLYANF